jgi:hypothetical protein
MCEEPFTAHATFLPEGGRIVLVTADDGVSIHFVRVLEAADVTVHRVPRKKGSVSLPSIQVHLPLQVMEALVELYERSKK